jgi:hemerythrin superfamily protein
MDVRKTAVEMLMDQHQHIRKLIDEVENSAGAQRQRAFDELRRFLAVHEAAEEVVTHPAIEEFDKAVAEARLAEEHEAKKALADLEDIDVATPDFDVRFARLKTMVLAHADAEEREEFPLLEAALTPDQQLTAADALRAVEDIAPTHPHPSAGESAVGNLVAAPVAALVDKARDAVSAVLRR